jgi:hypothetical protein
MSDHTAGAATLEEVEKRRRIYQLVLGFNMGCHVVISLGCMFASDLVSDIFHLPRPVPTGWIKGWGATLLLVTALYIPGLLDPLRNRYPNICGVGGRLWMATVWLVIGGGFFWFGVFDLSFAIIIGALYWWLLKSQPVGRRH